MFAYFIQSLYLSPNPGPDMEACGSEEKALSIAAAGSRKGNPEKVREAVDNKTSSPFV